METYLSNFDGNVVAWNGINLMTNEGPDAV